MGCRKRAPVTDLLRVVVRSGALVPDPRRRLPGRGASVHPTRECLHAAERRRAFPGRCASPEVAVRRWRPVRSGTTSARPPGRPARCEPDRATAVLGRTRHQAGPHVDRTPSDDSAVKFSR
ncbi:YlxR family protein [Blastococcus sp. PRF04-17]|uniref:YlxR family protein n=1 Tax=Blastococcus sp. PRF04-17 TaxID=2933797 RepID=UPI001FF48D7C|nr:YlxR family protein [Blastococcus sp. PRF04-17]UOY04087.1 YlxR family protein [Blastococcus sp. PRF04-17]